MFKYIESEIYTAIAARLLDLEVESHYTDEDHVAPVTVGIYNRDYEEVPQGEEELPFNRPAVFVEFQNYRKEDKGAYLSAPVPVIIHVVQDSYVSARENLADDLAKHKALLVYPELITDLLHQLEIENGLLNIKGVDPDHDHKGLLVHKIRMEIKARRSVVRV